MKPRTQCAIYWGVITGSVTSVLLVIFGVLALIPSAPYAHRDLTAGIVMIVLAGIGFVLAASAGALCGCVCGELCEDIFD